MERHVVMTIQVTRELLYVDVKRGQLRGQLRGQFESVTFLHHVKLPWLP
jgi:hypothetical protein